MNFNFKLSGKHAKYVILFTTLTCENITQFSQGMESLLLFGELLIGCVGSTASKPKNICKTTVTYNCLICFVFQLAMFVYFLWQGGARGFEDTYEQCTRCCKAFYEQAYK